MRKLVLAVAVMMVCGVVQAQVQSSMSKEDLENQILSLQTQLELKNKEDASRFAGLGKEVGMIMQSLVSTLDGAATVSIEKVNQFSETKAGKAAMIMVIWKYIGKDVVEFVWNKFAAILLLVIGIFWIRYGASRLFFGYRRNTSKDTWENVESMVKMKDVSSDSFCVAVIIFSVVSAILVIPALVNLF